MRAYYTINDYSLYEVVILCFSFHMELFIVIFKSPRNTGGDFMFLYRFVPWIFKVKYRICYISAKNGLIATKRKANISIVLKDSNVTIRSDLVHDLDLEFSRSNMEFPISQLKVVRLPRNKEQTYRLNSRPQMWPMCLTLTITLTFEFWRSNVTFTFDHTHDLDHGF